MKILVTGGAGYVGHKLVPRMAMIGHQVTAYDLCLFGQYFTPKQLSTFELVQADIRDTDRLALWLKGVDAVVHMACISNDPSAELDEEMARSINLDAFEPLVVAAKAAGVRRFVYCSTSSVYGISEDPDVTEEHPLVPLTVYNTTKAQCEPLLFKHTDDKFTGVILRPSTLCGYSPRQRLDLAVNILTNHAVNKGVITVLGGEQKRPNLHIDDMVDAYLMCLHAPRDKVANQIYNVGARNMTLNDLATLVQGVVFGETGVKPTIKHEESIDKRSYQVNSDKFRKAFRWDPLRKVEDGVTDLVRAFKEGLLPDPLNDDRYYNVRSLKAAYNSGVLSEIDMHRGAVGNQASPA